MLWNECQELQLVGQSYSKPDTVERCWLLEVPEDYTQPEGKKIKIAVAKTLSLNEKKGAILYLNGGPGGMSLNDAEYSDSYLSALASNHDIYFVDQRGTGYSIPSLSCSFGDSGTTRQIKNCKNSFANRGIALDKYTNVNSALDLLILEKKLTAKNQLNDGWKLYGVSYGTRLAMTMAREEQKQVIAGYQQSAATRMMILDGVFPIEVAAIDLDYGTNDQIEEFGVTFSYQFFESNTTT